MQASDQSARERERERERAKDAQLNQESAFATAIFSLRDLPGVQVPKNHPQYKMPEAQRESDVRESEVADCWKVPGTNRAAEEAVRQGLTQELK